MKILFFKISEDQKAIIREKLNDAVFIDNVLDSNNLPTEHSDADILSCFVDSTVDKKVLDFFPNLKFIATLSTGYDNISVEECKKNNIKISNVPTYGEITVAEYTFALILSLSRKICIAYHKSEYEKFFGSESLRGFDLNGKTLGVVGTGKIGRNVIKLGKSFGMNILAFDTFKDEKISEELGFKYVDLDSLLSNSDIVTLHVPYLESTHHLINKNNINLFKKGSYLINTSRGGVVETDALVQALSDGHLAGAGLDVLEEEKLSMEGLLTDYSERLEGHNIKTVLENKVLFDFPNVIVTFHNAFNSKEAIERITKTTVENIEAYISGTPTNLV